MNDIRSRKNHFIFFIIFIINLLFSKQEIIEYKMEISIGKQELDVFHINSEGDICNQWIPSLLSPLPLIFKEVNISQDFLRISMYNPIVIQEESIITVYIHEYKFLKQKFDTFIGRLRDSEESGSCYLGLLPKLGVNKDLNESYIFLNTLAGTNQIENKIFSFDKWELSLNSIKTSFYLGSSHNHFIKNNEKAIIGTCKTNRSEPYWGCQFDQMSYKGKVEDLSKDNINFKVYFYSEAHIIIFPLKFKEKFNNITDNKCTYDEEHKDEPEYYLSCDDLFKEENYTSINLINKDMNITIEIDNNKRYNDGENINGRTRIKYEEVDYFIFPLIMFKNFHIEFNDEENSIKFFTTDESILQVKKKENKKEKKKSNGLKIFLIICLIIIILALITFAFWFIKKRKTNYRNNINKYNKFEDEEDFKNMNEKRVF